MNMQPLMEVLDIYFLGWPLIIAVLIVGALCTVATNFIQIRHFFTAWKYILFPKKTPETETGGNVTPVQAFINTLSANLGNGGLAGMANAIYLGGPGAVFWVLVIGILLMAVRFAEVYLSTYFGSKATQKSGLGGPMLYLKQVPGGTFLSIMYGVVVFIFSLIVGAALQTNTIALALKETWNIPNYVTALTFFMFILYVVTGGAQRISKASEKIVPLKVGTFCIASVVVLCYNWSEIIPSLKLIFDSAFTPAAVAGGIVGFTVKQAMRFGISRAIFATESGLGTAAILFGFTGSRTPVKDGIISMLSTFISTLVCFVLGLCMVASGAWNSGLDSSAMTIVTYASAFGWLGGWIISFLSISFGVGVIVAFAYISRETWFFLTNGRYGNFFDVLYCCIAAAGALVAVSMMWNIADIVNGIILMTNLFGLAYLTPAIVRGVTTFNKTQEG